jgi:hypothetical protein
MSKLEVCDLQWNRLNLLSLSFLWKQEASQVVTTGEGIALATSTIKNTELERKVQAFQTTCYGKDTWSLSNLYWRGFIRQHAESLSLAKGN